jgi:hypothetical protein
MIAQTVQVITERGAQSGPPTPLISYIAMDILLAFIVFNIIHVYNREKKRNANKKSK